MTSATGDVVITQPANGGYVSGPLAAANAGGNVEIRGNAKGGDFMAYKVFVGPGYEVAPEQWQQIGPDHGNQVDNNLLENWNLAGFAPGVYSVKLTRLEHNGAATDAVIRVTVDNISPTVTLVTPQPGEVFTVGKDEWIDVKAQVQDDNTISRVEFYANDPAAPFAVKTVAPFNVKWTIPLGGGGSVELWAVAVDGAGNRSESERVQVVLAYE